MKTPSVKTTYTDKAIPALMKELSITNRMALPRIAKVVVNVGIGKILKDQKRVDEVVASLEAITGQKVLLTKARKAIAGFKIREDLEIGDKSHIQRAFAFIKERRHAKFFSDNKFHRGVLSLLQNLSLPSFLPK